jgi:hypothetical protein
MSEFYRVIAAAIADMAQHGYDSEDRVAMWAKRIRAASIAALRPESELRGMLERQFGKIYNNLVNRGQLLKLHPGITRFTLEWIKPKLHVELERRMMASANLIKLNRVAMIEKTQQRFRGWATSIPPGGSRAVAKRETAVDIKKAMGQLPFEERRVIIDQGHKFTATLSNIVAVDSGAIAAIWHSHYRQPGYNYREDHKERDDKIYLIRGSWAQEKGFVKPGIVGYLDGITQPGEEVFCRCTVTYIYAIRDLPATMVTKRGQDELERVRAELAK